MKPVKQRTLDELESLTVDSVKQIRALFAYEGDNATYLQKAKIGVGVIGGYSRVLASENNRAALESLSHGRKVLPELQS
jgi:hypothetical protein